MVKGLIFDMDGLLFDTERIVQRSWNCVGERHGYPGLGNHIYHTIGFNRARRSVYFKGIYGEDFPHSMLVNESRIVFENIVQREGIPVKSGAKEILAFAKGQGLGVGLATSSSEENASEELKQAGLYDYFDGFLFGNMVTKSKPDPEIYERACQAIHIKPEEGIAFEDAPAGVESAYGAGLKVIMVPDLVQPDETVAAMAFHVTDSLTTALELLRRELAKN